MPNTPPTGQNQIIRQLLIGAKQAAKNNRRAEARIPFFRPVSIKMNDHCYSAFSREISDSAIGLLHNMELPLGEVEISIATEQGLSAKLATQMEWCQPCGAGWYISGGRFIGQESDVT